MLATTQLGICTRMLSAAAGGGGGGAVGEGDGVGGGNNDEEQHEASLPEIETTEFWGLQEQLDAYAEAKAMQVTKNTHTRTPFSLSPPLSTNIDG